MSKGLSNQQKQILAMLRFKTLPNSDRTYFSTQEIVCELYPEYKLWLMDAKENPFTRNRKTHIDYSKNDKRRISVYRALRNLEKRGNIVSFTLCRGGRHWAVPERVTSNVRPLWTQTDYEQRSVFWRWAAFIRTLPPNLRFAYKFTYMNQKGKDEIARLWNLYKENRFK